MIYPYGETVTRHRPTYYDPPEVDRYGNDIPNVWVDGDIPGVALAPTISSDSDSPGRSAVISGLTLYAPTGTDIAPRDRITARGVLYEIVGEVADWRSPFGPMVDGIEVNLKRVDG